MLGPLLAFGLLQWGMTMEHVFMAVFVPGAAHILILVFGLKMPPSPRSSRNTLPHGCTGRASMPGSRDWCWPRVVCRWRRHRRPFWFFGPVRVASLWPGCLCCGPLQWCEGPGLGTSWGLVRQVWPPADRIHWLDCPCAVTHSLCLAAGWGHDRVGAVSELCGGAGLYRRCGAGPVGRLFTCRSARYGVRPLSSVERSHGPARCPALRRCLAMAGDEQRICNGCYTDDNRCHSTSAAGRKKSGIKMMTADPTESSGKICCGGDRSQYGTWDLVL